ncbi:MAG: hypothetical protein SGJ27_07110 [Candidatus Melainabacteria bacterium]|nr:hypothetical protein [Candidatus Melainabacteria bacterium]
MRRTLLILKVFLIACIIFAPLACFASVREESVNCAVATLDTIIFWLAIAPEILNLILILLSLYLMLDGVRRWGTNASGAFSRTLIGLFVLHTTSLEISFLPYLALFLEIWLCARGVEARTAARLKAEKEAAAKTELLNAEKEFAEYVELQCQPPPPLTRSSRSSKRRAKSDPLGNQAADVVPRSTADGVSKSRADSVPN